MTEKRAWYDERDVLHMTLADTDTCQPERCDFHGKRHLVVDTTGGQTGFFVPERRDAVEQMIRFLTEYLEETK